MARFVALDALVFFLPFLLYWAWISLQRRRPSDPRSWEGKVLAALTIAGAVAIAVTVILLIHFDQTPGGLTYHPPEMKDGQIVPGHFE